MLQLVAATPAKKKKGRPLLKERTSHIPNTLQGASFRKRKVIQIQKSPRKKSMPSPANTGKTTSKICPENNPHIQMGSNRASTSNLPPPINLIPAMIRTTNAHDITRGRSETTPSRGDNPHTHITTDHPHIIIPTSATRRRTIGQRYF